MLILIEVSRENNYTVTVTSQHIVLLCLAFVILATKVSSPTSNQPLTKTQKKNLAKKAKEREEKKLRDEIQAERLRQHRQSLGTERVNESYKDNKQKSSVNSRNVNTIKPTVSLNEAGALVWN